MIPDPKSSRLLLPETLKILALALIQILNLCAPQKVNVVLYFEAGEKDNMEYLKKVLDFQKKLKDQSVMNLTFMIGAGSSTVRITHYKNYRSNFYTTKQT